MAESLEQRLQRSLAEADAKKAEKAKLAEEGRRAEQEIERQKAEKVAGYGFKYDELQRVVWKFKSTLESQPSVKYRMMIDEKPNPSPQLRSCSVTFIEKETSRSDAFLMHMTKNGIFQIGPLGSQMISSGVHEITGERMEDMLMDRFVKFSQPD